MPRDARYDILFEPVRIGPVIARNRFYQVPHCTSLGWFNPHGSAALRGIKAEGGWAVVNTEECSIHPTSDGFPYAENRIWDDHDRDGLHLMVEAVHRHGALVGCQLSFAGHSLANRSTRIPPYGSSSLPISYSLDPYQSRSMSRDDIRQFRRWHRDAALRARSTGFDIIYVYAGHNLSIAMHFLLKRYNQRTDEYGGSLENRARLLRELIEETKEAVGDTCAVAVRFAVDELLGPEGLSSDGEARDVVEMLAELPDLWDVNLSDWPNDSVTSRFAKEGFQEPFISFVKGVTSKPVVGVGRFTSPDTMVSQMHHEVLDLIGAARPSIADPFLPRKIEEGRIDDIRECIGCNMCVLSQFVGGPIRCTQNPTIGEEWRRGWHPETLAPSRSDARVLVVGGGPAGLEAARALGQSGYSVTLAEATDSLGGRVSRESRLPGLSEWARVRDWRVGQLNKLPNVEMYLGSRLSAAEVLAFGFEHVVVATGATWRRDGVGRSNAFPLTVHDGATVLTPDDLMEGHLPEGDVVIFDDDQFYMGGVLAELLVAHGCEVTLATPGAEASTWTQNTMECARINTRLAELGVQVLANSKVVEVEPGGAMLEHGYRQGRERHPCASVVLVTCREPRDELYRSLCEAQPQWRGAGIQTVGRIGDCNAPGPIEAAVFSGHAYARRLEVPGASEAEFKRERLVLGLD